MADDDARTDDSGFPDDDAEGVDEEDAGSDFCGGVQIRAQHRRRARLERERGAAPAGGPQGVGRALGGEGVEAVVEEHGFGERRPGRRAPVVRRRDVLRDRGAQGGGQLVARHHGRRGAGLGRGAGVEPARDDGRDGVGQVVRVADDRRDKRRQQRVGADGGRRLQEVAPEEGLRRGVRRDGTKVGVDRPRRRRPPAGFAACEAVIVGRAAAAADGGRDRRGGGWRRHRLRERAGERPAQRGRAGRRARHLVAAPRVGRLGADAKAGEGQVASCARAGRPGRRRRRRGW